MLPLSHLSAGQLASVRFVLTDIDDTLTDGGKLTAEAYTAMWNLFHAGVKVIAVTGRPAGWCDAIARQWPVAAVVGENGAFVFSETNGRLDMLHNPRAADADSAQERLSVLWKTVQQEVPRARIAKDQFSRIYDIAIDFAEEHPHLTREEVRKIH
ncbi:MAG: HAD-IIB family hydrolase, partial [Spirochaeta sp.]